MIIVEFQLTADDYAEARVGHVTKVMRKIFVLGITVLAMAFAATSAIALMDPTTRSQLVPIWIGFGGLVLLVVLLRSKIPYRLQFRRMKALHEPIYFEACEGGVTFRTPKGESKINWGGFEKWDESERSFLLYVQPRLYFLVPKRVLDAEQAAVLRDFLGNHVR
jgi:YcxB-like protein